MRSSFFGFEVARSALNSSQIALDTVNHNVAGQHISGYSRQEAVWEVNRPFTTPSMNKPVSAGQIGTGVNISQIRRLRDTFADQQYRKENKYYGQAEAMEKGLEQIELIYNEPSDTAIRSCLDEFWKELQNLSTNAESTAVRTTLKQRTLQLTDSLNHAANQLESLRKDINSEMSGNVDTANSLLRRIADLNKSIVRVESTGDNANDYRDTRDSLIDELSKIINVQMEEDSNGAVNIFIQGKLAVGVDSCNEIKAVQVDDPLNEGQKIYDIVWADTGRQVGIVSGTLSGQMKLRDEVIPTALQELDTLAVTTAQHINTLHSGGVGLDGQTGYDFFVSTNTTNVKAVSSYVFDAAGKQPLAKLENFQIMINGKAVEVKLKDLTADADGNVTNQAIMAEIARSANVAGVSDSIRLFQDSTNNQVRMEISSEGNLTFSPIGGVGDLSNAEKEFLKGLGFTNASGMAKAKVSAKDITLNKALQDNLRLMAAAKKPDDFDPADPTTFPGAADGGNALAMANVKKSKVLIGNSITEINDYYNSSVVQIGVQSLEATSTLVNKKTLLNGIESRRQSVQGVSEDDELVNMIKFNRLYSAASRIVNTYDEMLDTIINRMGV